MLPDFLWTAVCDGGFPQCRLTDPGDEILNSCKMRPVAELVWSSQGFYPSVVGLFATKKTS